LALIHPRSLPGIAREDARKRAYDPAIHPIFVKTSCEEDGYAGQARA
jgi:hypothetical protein